MEYDVLLGFGIGWLIIGLVNLLFSNKKFVRKIDKEISEYELEEGCFKNRIGAILYLLMGTLWIILFSILK